MKKLTSLQLTSLVVYALLVAIIIFAGQGKVAFIAAGLLMLFILGLIDWLYSEGSAQITLGLFAALCVLCATALSSSVVEGNRWILAPIAVFLLGYYHFSAQLARELLLYKEPVLLSTLIHGIAIYALLALWYPAIG